MENDNKYLELAYKQALLALKEDEVPIGAIIVKDNKVIARAHNKKETKKQATRHAEIEAIEKASKKLNNWHLDDCSLYVTLEPCMMCVGAIIQSRIKRVIYGAKDSKGGAIESNILLSSIKGLNHYPETKYLENENCSKILSNYFKNKRK